MSETRNIVILGASVGGLSAAHYLCKHTLPKLKQSKEAKYVLHLVDPSTHFWWHISAPRAMVSTKEIKHSAAFVPIMDGFKQYSNLKDSIVFHQAEATGLDASARRVTLKNTDGKDEALDYYSLIIATGIRSPTPATTLHGEHTISMKALDEMNEKIAGAKEVVIGGGGPIAVETAGEIAFHRQGKTHVTLIAGADKLLPVLSKKFSDKAERKLTKVGVKVLYKTRVKGTEPGPDGKTTVQLDNGTSMSADVYIPAVGVTPNTAFIPTNLKHDNGYVKTNRQTMRVDEAGPRVYAVGDVSAVDVGGVVHMFNSIPVFGANISHDLLKDAKLGNVAEKTYQAKNQETELVPIGPKTGIGAFNGWGVPAMMISMFKGKDFMLSQMSSITEGKKWSKA